MFQSGDEQNFSFQEPKIKEFFAHDASRNKSVVRTESHVARFNTAKALFEKMSESNKISLKEPKNCRLSSLSANGRIISRSPSPASRPSQNTDRTNTIKSNMPSVATISSLAISPPISPVSSLISPSSTSPVPRSITSSCRTLSASSSDSGDYPRRKDMKKGEADADVETYDETDLSPPIDAKDTSISREEHFKIPTKPNKPRKPETLKHSRRTNHEYHKELIQRHKNWFKSYSRAKSPSSPVKSDSDRATSPEVQSMSRILNTSCPEQKTKSECELTKFNSLRKKPERFEREEKHELVKAYFSGNQTLSAGRKIKPSTSSLKQEVDNSSTLPSTWCPPAQYIKPKDDSNFSRRKASLHLQNQDRISDDSEQVTCRRSLDYSSLSNFPRISNRSSSADELENRLENVILRRNENFNSLSDVPVLRHSFHREPHQNVEREYRQDRRFSSLEGDRERRLQEWERKKFEREKRNSEGNLPAYLISKYRTGTGSLFHINSEGNVLKQIKKYESKFSESSTSGESIKDASTTKPKKSSEMLKIDIGEELMRKKEIEESEKKRREKIDQERRHKEEDLQKRLAEQETRRQDSERRQKESDLLDRLRKEEEQIKRKRKEEAQQKRKENVDILHVEEEIERITKEQETFEIRRKERENERKTKEQEMLQLRMKEQEEMERKIKEEEDSRYRQQVEFEIRLKEQQDNERRRI